jgi:hypothetical protein
MNGNLIMGNHFTNLRNLEKGIKISLPTDENGLVGRECPNPPCHGYFKVRSGTGLKGNNLPCHCPYCGYTAGYDQFLQKSKLNIYNQLCEIKSHKHYIKI